MVDVSDLVGPAVRGYIDAGLTFALDSFYEGSVSISSSSLTANAMITIIDDVIDFILSNDDLILIVFQDKTSWGFSPSEAAELIGSEFYSLRNVSTLAPDSTWDETSNAFRRAAWMMGKQTFVVTDNGDVEVM